MAVNLTRGETSSRYRSTENNTWIDVNDNSYSRKNDGDGTDAIGLGRRVIAVNDFTASECIQQLYKILRKLGKNRHRGNLPNAIKPDVKIKLWPMLGYSIGSNNLFRRRAGSVVTRVGRPSTSRIEKTTREIREDVRRIPSLNNNET